MARTSVGIYISPKNVDIIELAGSKSAPVLVNFIRQQIATDTVSDNAAAADHMAPYKDAVSDAVKEGFEKLHSSPHTIQTVLGSSDFMIRYFDMPVLPKSEQQQAVRFEAKKYIPFKLDEIASDFRVLAEPKKKKAMDVFFMAATKTQINSHVANFKSTGSLVSGIDIMPLALWKVLLLHKKIEAKDKVVIVYADNDRESVSIHILESGMPFMSRDFKIAIDDKEAVFEKIVSELRVSIDYYGRQKHTAEILKVVTCGEMLFSGLDAYIADELKVVTSALYDFVKVKHADTLSPSAILALGSAIEGLGQSSYSVNFSPLVDAIKHKKTYNIVVVEAIAALVIVALCYIFNSFLIKSIVSELKTVKRGGKSLPANTSRLNLEQLKSRKENMIKDTNFMSLVVNNRVSWAVKLASIANDLTSINTEITGGVWINSLSLKEDFVMNDSVYPSEIARRILMSGSSFLLDSSKETAYVNSFFTSLQRDEAFMANFNNIDLGSVDRKNVEGELMSTFTIDAYSGEVVDAGSKLSKSRRTGRR